MKKVEKYLSNQKPILVFPILLVFSFLWWELLNWIFSTDLQHLTLFTLSLATTTVGTYALWVKKFSQTFYSNLEAFEERSKKAQTPEELVEIKIDIALFYDSHKRVFPEMLDERDKILLFINTRLEYEFKIYE